MATAHGRFDYLDGIRAVAIGAVLVLHWLSWYSPLLPRRLHRRRHLLRAQRLHHHHDAVARAGARLAGRRPGGPSSGAGWSGSTPPCSVWWSVAVVLYAVRPVGAARRRRGRRAAALLALGQASAFWAAGQDGSSGCPACTRSARPGRWRSSGTSTCSGRSCVLGARARGWSARRLAPRQPRRGRAALPAVPAAGDVLVLLRPHGAVRRAAGRRRAGAVVPGRDGPPDAAVARRATPASVLALAAIGALHAARRRTRQPALPLRRHAGGRARDRGADPRRLQQPARAGAPAARPPVAGDGGPLQLQPLPVAHRAVAAARGGRVRCPSRCSG